MPMMIPPSGGLPSPLAQAPHNSGPGAMPQGNLGNIQAALVKVQNASKMLQEALPLIPFGSEEHIKLQKILTQLAEAVKKAGENPALQIASMQASIKNQAHNAQMSQMARMFAAHQGAGQPPAVQPPAAPQAA